MKLGVTGVVGDLIDSTLMRTFLDLHFPGQVEPLRIEAYGLQRMRIRTPSRPPESDQTQLFKGLRLADPTFA